MRRRPLNLRAYLSRRKTWTQSEDEGSHACKVGTVRAERRAPVRRCAGTDGHHAGVASREENGGFAVVARRRDHQHATLKCKVYGVLDLLRISRTAEAQVFDHPDRVHGRKVRPEDYSTGDI